MRPAETVLFTIGDNAVCVFAPSGSGLQTGSIYTVRSVWNATLVELVAMPGVLHTADCFARSKATYSERGVATAVNACAKCSAPLPCKYHEEVS